MGVGGRKKGAKTFTRYNRYTRARSEKTQMGFS